MSPTPLFERDDALTVLTGAVDRACSGTGSVIAISGEPGIGKTSLVDQVRIGLPPGTALIAGGCDDTSIPRPLGPFVDAAADGALDPADVTSAELLRRRLVTLTDERPLTVVIVEDAQWADEATLDVFAHLARRIATARCLGLVTFRPDPDPASPVRRALAAAPAAAVTHIELRPLSIESVRTLVEPHHRHDADHIHAVTGGNPFLVTELLRSDDRIPATVRDSAASRMAALREPARNIAACLSVAPAAASWALVEELDPTCHDAIDQLERAGLLTTGTNGVTFTHDLIRRAIEAEQSGAVRRRHHRSVLEALRTIDGHPADIAHHAAAIGDVDLLIEASTAACERSARAGAHVEALAHVERILPHATSLPADDRRRLFRTASHEYSVNHRLRDALDLAERCVELGADASPTDRAEALAWLSLVEWWLAHVDTSRRHLDEALAVLDGTSPSADLLRRVATDLAHRSRWTDAWTWATRALERAAATHDERALGQALSAAEMIGAVVDDPDVARERGDRAMAIFRRYEMQRDLWIASGNRVANALNTLRIEECAPAIAAAIELDGALDAASYTTWLNAQRARHALYTGAWDVARALADEAAAAIPDGLHRATPLVVQALLAARCDVPRPELLDEAARLVGTTDDIQRVGNVAIAIAEHSWLGSDVDDSWIEHAIRLAAESGHGRYVAELAVWNRRLAHPTGPVESGPPPLLAELDGDWRAAADEWAALGCPYESALALAFSGDPDAMQEAAHVAVDLGARRAADRIRQMLREAGVTSSRGPRASTRRNRAGLTNRQVEVAELLADGFTNAEIAERLYVSPKTVDHHVSAVLTKLGVDRRTEVAEALTRLAEPT